MIQGKYIFYAQMVCSSCFVAKFYFAEQQAHPTKNEKGILC
jgi:hypothetical protein